MVVLIVYMLMYTEVLRDCRNSPRTYDSFIRSFWQAIAGGRAQRPVGFCSDHRACCRDEQSDLPTCMQQAVDQMLRHAESHRRSKDVGGMLNRLLSGHSPWLASFFSHAVSCSKNKVACSLTSAFPRLRDSDEGRRKSVHTVIPDKKLASGNFEPYIQSQGEQFLLVAKENLVKARELLEASSRSEHRTEFREGRLKKLVNICTVFGKSLALCVIALKRLSKLSIRIHTCTGNQPVLVVTDNAIRGVHDVQEVLNSRSKAGLKYVFIVSVKQVDKRRTIIARPKVKDSLAEKGSLLKRKSKLAEAVSKLAILTKPKVNFLIKPDLIAVRELRETVTDVSIVSDERGVAVWNEKKQKYRADEFSLAIISALRAIGCDVDFLVHQPMIISYRALCFPQSAKAVIGLGLPTVTVSDLCLLAIVGSLLHFNSYQCKRLQIGVLRCLPDELSTLAVTDRSVCRIIGSRFDALYDGCQLC
ncbi:endonuclease-reverse transcriptase [Clonorchis sinensis]|uniref:Endonuclease-reverse transcriptase n=1 Tax=Clonorchis sinensis TaxID=79923 RepID=G7YDX0_CLOSI|nr:endonuclease-reverse transcriptase [Clonorchis sinensis]